MRLPPRPVRRPLQVAGLLLVAAVVVGTLPVTLPLAALAGLVLGSGPLRLVLFAVVLVAVELLGALSAVLLWAVGRARDERLHEDVLRALLDEVVRAARLLLGLRLVTDELGWSPLDDGVPGSTNAMVVLARHAGAGDSLLLVHTLLDRDHLRRPRIVLKDLLRLDPLVDGYLGRLRTAFLPPGGDSEALVAEAARELGEEDALLLFPEGGNFSPGRRTRAIASLRGKGLTSAAEAAERMCHVLPPRPGGVAAALEAAPHADVVLVAHEGLEALDSLGAVLRRVPLRRPVHLRWDFVPAAEVPRGRQEQVDWLFERWAEMDRWIAARAADPDGERWSAGRRPEHYPRSP